MKHGLNLGLNCILILTLYNGWTLAKKVSAPEITESPTDTLCVDNQNVTLICRVLGVPKPNIKWIRNAKELTGGRYNVGENGNLNIAHVQFGDSGNYTCYAENKMGHTSASASLYVNSHTYIVDTLEYYEVRATTTATLRCHAIADNSLDLEIIWFRNGKPISYAGDSRFSKSLDYSLTITKTHVSDSGTYMCLARTILDEATAHTQLTIQDIPNPPQLLGVECTIKDATIRWIPMGDNRAPILHYIIQYNTSFIPEEWKDFGSVPSVDTTYNIPLEPWVNYTFRVIAVNEIGQSEPSSHSYVCTTPAKVPSKNPENVRGEGNRPDNLVITWMSMPQIEHGAPGFKYHVGWKRAIDGEDYTFVDIHDYKQDRLIIPNQPSFKEYNIVVSAANELGYANVAPQVVTGYSGEDQPLEAPNNFSILAIFGPTTALLGWEPVPMESVRGHFRGYKIKTWSKISPRAKEIQIHAGASEAVVSNFDPYTTNYAQIYVINKKFIGPPSPTISFETPEGTPEPIQDFQAYPLGSSSFLLKWAKPKNYDGILMGYNIYWSKVDSFIKVDTPNPRTPQIRDPNVNTAKLSGLEAGSKYRIYITAITKAAESEKYFIEIKTGLQGNSKPSKPSFEWAIVKHGSHTSIRIHWLPAEDGNGGNYFFVKYRKHGETNWEESVPEIYEDWTIIDGLEDSIVYDFIVTAVDGPSFQFHTDSEIQEIRTYRAPQVENVIHDFSDVGDLDNKSYGLVSMNSDHKQGLERDYHDGDLETEETRNLTTSQLQRLVLLEELQVLRLKKEQLLRNQDIVH